MEETPDERSQKLDCGRHGRLDVDSLDVVPSLFKERGQEVQRHHNVLLELFIGHLDVTDGGGEAGDLLKLELNGGSGISDLGGEGFLVGNNSWESLDSGEDGSNNDGDLLEDGVGSEEERVLLGPLLDNFLVLVELLEFIKRGQLDVEASGFGLCLVLSISDQADLETGTGAVGKSDGTDESLILLGIVILKANLELNSFSELSGLDGSTEVDDSLEHFSVSNLSTHFVVFMIYKND